MDEMPSMSSLDFDIAETKHKNIQKRQPLNSCKWKYLEKNEDYYEESGGK